MTTSTPSGPVIPPAPRPPVVGVVGQVGPRVLVQLRRTMEVALEAVMVARRHPSVAVRLQATREDYLAAIVAYEQALTALGLPIPPRLRDEGRLMRRLLPSQRSGRLRR